MKNNTFSSREFNQDLSAAKHAALEGPVFITNRGKPEHVLLSMELYEALTGKAENIVEQLAMPSVADIDFEPEKLDKNLFKDSSLD